MIQHILYETILENNVNMLKVMGTVKFPRKVITILHEYLLWTARAKQMALDKLDHEGLITITDLIKTNKIPTVKIKVANNSHTESLGHQKNIETA